MTDQVTESSVDDADASASPIASEDQSSEKVEITQEELEGLGQLLESLVNTILGHEARLLEHEGRITELEGKKPVKLEIPRGRSR